MKSLFLGSKKVYSQGWNGKTIEGEGWKLNGKEVQETKHIKRRRGMSGLKKHNYGQQDEAAGHGHAGGGGREID